MSAPMSGLARALVQAGRLSVPQADAFQKYLTETCGNPLDDIEMPELPEMPGSTE